MSDPILTTKLYIPVPGREHIVRLRLIQCLDQGVKGKVTLISAPAGYGKTTLLSEWTAQSEMPVAWLTLDQNDNDLGRFLAYLIACLHSISLPIDVQILQLLQSKQTSQIDALLIPIVNQIAAEERRFALILEDYHLIQTKEIHDALVYLIDHIPSNMHLVISGRADPPLQLARLRARGEMTEIRAADLRFSVEEGHSLLNQVHGLVIPIEDIVSLIGRTEGWVAALQLAAIAANGKANVSEYINGITGTHNYIADFLASEVLNQQPEIIVDFLLKTSILEQFSGSLCDAVTGRNNSHQILKQLRDANLFLISLDDENLWFRYHQLFADLLNQRLLEAFPTEVPDLYRQASAWFRTNDYLAEAIECALKGNLMTEAADMIEEHAKAILMRSEIGTFIRWVKKLPDDLVYNKDLLCIYYAWALLHMGEDTQLAGKYLDHISPGNDQTTGQIEAVRSILAIYQGQPPEAIELATRALARLPDDDLFFRLTASWILSAALFISGDYSSGARILEEIAQIGVKSKNLLVAISALCRLGTYYTQLGDLCKAKELFDKALKLAIADSDRPLPIACEAMLGLGKIHWEWNQLEMASHHLLESVEYSKRWRETTAIESYVLLAHLNHSLGDDIKANQAIREAQNLAFQKTTTDIDDKFVASEEAYLHLRQGNLPAAEKWASERKFHLLLQEQDISTTPNRGADIVLRYELLVYARILLAQNQITKSLELLSLLLHSIESLGHLQKIIGAYTLKALCLRTQRKIPEALTALRKALDLAEKGGFQRIFLEEGTIIIEMLQQISDTSKSRYAAELLTAYHENIDKAPSGRNLSALVDPMSDREMDVLRLLETSMTSNEIAEVLHIAVSTARVHIKHIYAKLGVNRRFEAVAKAKDLQIL